MQRNRSAELTSQFYSEKQIRQYFLGSIVLIEDENERSLHNIVDGQQRIISLTIIFSVLRALFKEKDLINKTHDAIFRNEDELAGIKGGYRLRGVRDGDFFEQYIQQIGKVKEIKKFTPTSPSTVTERYQLNTRRVLKTLQQYADTADELQKFARWLFSECVLIVISTKNTKSAFQIFNSLNGRGTPLSHIDVLKAEILAAVPTSQESASYGAKWDHYEDTFGPNKFKKLFQYIYMIKSYKNVEEDTFAADFKEIVNPHAKPLDFFNNTFLRYAKAFQIVLSSDISKLHKEGEDIDGVNKLLWLLTRNKDCVDHVTPCLVAYLNQEHTLKDIKEFLWRMERRWAYHLVKKTGYKEQQEFSFEIIKAIQSTAFDKYDKLYQILDQEFTTASKGKTPISWKEDLRKQLQKPVYKATDIAVSKYLLLRINSELSHEPGAWRVDDSKLTIEHILPQTLSEEWKKKWPNTNSAQAQVHKLGNLALLTRSINSTVQNASFETKKAQFLKDKKNKKISARPITVELQEYHDWTKTEFDTRHRRFCTKLESVWDIGLLTSSAKKTVPAATNKDSNLVNNNNMDLNNIEVKSLKRKREDDIVTDENAQSEPPMKKQKILSPIAALGRNFRPGSAPPDEEEEHIEVTDNTPSSPTTPRTRKAYPRRTIKDLVDAGQLAVGAIVTVKNRPDITATIDMNGLIDGHELKEWLGLVSTLFGAVTI